MEKLFCSKCNASSQRDVKGRLPLGWAYEDNEYLCTKCYLEMLCPSFCENKDCGTCPGCETVFTPGRRLNILIEVEMKKDGGMSYSEAFRQVMTEYPSIATEYANEIERDGFI
jgi:Zn-finger nucleic acid-binding protein